MKARNLRGNLFGYAPEQIAEIFVRIRARNYLVHMIPNTVSAALCADGLAALGARPLMAVATEEMPEIVSQADGCVINLGQLTKEKQKAAKLALMQGTETGRPLVLDPVGCGASQFRMQAVQELLELSWQGILKGNRSELYSIQQRKLTREGIDSLEERSLVRQIPPGRVYLVTGKTDEILWEGETIQIPHRAVSRWNIVGAGCLAGAVTGACCCAAAELIEESSGSRGNTVEEQKKELSGDRGDTVEELTKKSSGFCSNIAERKVQSAAGLKDNALQSLKLAAVSASLGMSFALEQAGMTEGYGAAKVALLNALSLLSDTNFLDWMII